MACDSCPLDESSCESGTAAVVSGGKTAEEQENKENIENPHCEGLTACSDSKSSLCSTKKREAVHLSSDSDTINDGDKRCLIMGFVSRFGYQRSNNKSNLDCSSAETTENTNRVTTVPEVVETDSGYLSDGEGSTDCETPPQSQANSTKYTGNAAGIKVR